MKAIPMKATLAGFAILVPLALLAGYGLGDGAGGEAIAAKAPAGVPVAESAQEPPHPLLVLGVEDDRFALADPLGNRRRVRPVETLYVRHGHQITWHCAEEAEACAVHFSPISPFGQRRFMIPGGGTDGDTIRRDAEPGTYSYFVAVYTDGQIFTEDPDLIYDGGENDN